MLSAIFCLLRESCTLQAKFTSAENRELLQHSLILSPLDTLVDETSRLVGDKNDEEQESELVHHVFVHHTVVHSLDAD